MFIIPQIPAAAGQRAGQILAELEGRLAAARPESKPWDALARRRAAGDLV